MHAKVFYNSGRGCAEGVSALKTFLDEMTYELFPALEN